MGQHAGMKRHLAEDELGAGKWGATGQMQLDN
jgi:hypothetical protein